MSGATCCLRFPGQLNADLRKLAVNMALVACKKVLVAFYAGRMAEGGAPVAREWTRHTNTSAGLRGQTDAHECSADAESREMSRETMSGGPRQAGSKWDPQTGRMVTKRTSRASHLSLLPP